MYGEGEELITWDDYYASMFQYLVFVSIEYTSLRQSGIPGDEDARFGIAHWHSVLYTWLQLYRDRSSTLVI